TAAKQAFEGCKSVALDTVLDSFVINHPGETYGPQHEKEYEPMALRIVSQVMDAWYTEHGSKSGHVYMKARRLPQ
ncbi:MAG: hypothetical protein IKG22_10110, partial [Atopobiaceae bacterium]|nr:hypothetical protein [Atopobiaceae bacterium]